VVATVDRSVFFPTQVRVQGRTVSFVVPASFLSPSAVGGSSITALVTQAQLTIDAGINAVLGTPSTPRERFPLGAAQPDVGEPQFIMGFRNAPQPATSVVDLLSPDPAQQTLQLAPGGLLLGLNRENNMGAAPPAAPRAVTAAAAPAAAPAAGGGSWFSNALSAVTGLFSNAPAEPPATGTPQSVQSLMTPATTAAPAAAPAAAAVPAAAAAAPAAPATPQSVQTLMAPAGASAVASPVAPTAPVVAAPVVAAPPVAAPVVAAPAVAAPAAPVVAVPAPVVAAPRPPAPSAAAAAPAAPAAAAAPAATRPRDAAFFEEQEYRLRTLKRLRDSGLISEDEYVQKRREVLGQL
jgi:Short C-terminal domain